MQAVLEQAKAFLENVLAWLNKLVTVATDRRGTIVAAVSAVLLASKLVANALGYELDVDQLEELFGTGFTAVVVLVQALAGVVGVVIMVCTLIISWSIREPSGLQPFKRK